MEAKSSVPANTRPFSLDLILTRSCPMECGYCHMSQRAGTMPKRVWRKAVDLLLREEGPLELQMMGGEPLVEYDLVREVADYASAQARKKGKSLRLVLTTNGLFLSPKRSAQLAQLGFRVMLSFDGGRSVQTAQRGVRGGGAKQWNILRRNLHGLLDGGPPFFVNLVATPKSAGHLAKNVAFLLKEGVRAFQVAYALGVSWDRKSLDIMERQIKIACRRADAAEPQAEVFNRRSGIEPVLLSPQHAVDTDGRLYVGTLIVLEKLWPQLADAFRNKNIRGMTRLPGRRIGPADQLRRLRRAKLETDARKVFLNNLAVGYRMRQIWSRQAGSRGAYDKGLWMHGARRSSAVKS